MASYPFDDQFKTAVNNLPEWDGEAWNILINVGPPIGEALSDSLAEAGYSIDVVAAHLKALLNLPVDDLVGLA